MNSLKVSNEIFDFVDDLFLSDIDISTITETYNKNRKMITTDDLNTSGESVGSVIGLNEVLLMSAKRQHSKSGSNQNQVKPDNLQEMFNTSAITENDFFKIPITSTVKKRPDALENSTTPKMKRSHSCIGLCVYNNSQVNRNPLAEKNDQISKKLKTDCTVISKNADKLENLQIEHEITPKKSQDNYRTNLDLAFKSNSNIRTLQKPSIECDLSSDSSFPCGQKTATSNSAAKSQSSKYLSQISDISILDRHNITLMRELDNIFLSSRFSQVVNSNYSEQSICQNTVESKNAPHWSDEWTNDSFVNFVQNGGLSKVEKTISTDGFTSMGPFYDLPLKVKELITSSKGITELYDWQDECLKLPAVKQRRNLVYALPTSGGKTLVAEILLFREILCRNKNVLFILPYVSIVQEKFWALAPFQLALNFFAEEYAANKGTYPLRKRRNKCSVYIATIEKALNIVYNLYEQDRLCELGLIIVDEIHLLGEKQRGCILETLLTTILYLRKNIQIVGMSATIGNLNEISSFLNADIYQKDFRPVELTEYVKFEENIYKIDPYSEKMFVLERSVENISTRNDSIDPDHLGVLVKEIAYTASCLIFCPTKRNCENVALLLTTVLNNDILELNKIERQKLCAIMENDGRICPILKQTLPYGIAYHHSGLTQDERAMIEDSFRVGVINIICCTSTLAAGINLPAQRVILRSPFVGKNFITLSKYKQMIGRAGRAGFGEIGESIMICNRKDVPQVRELLRSKMDQAISSLHECDKIGLKTFILSAIGLKIATTRSDLVRLINYTLLYVQKEKLDINLNEMIDITLKSLIKTEIVFLKNVSVKTSSKLNYTITINSDPLSIPETSKNSNTTDSVVEANKIAINIDNKTELIVTDQGKAAVQCGIQIDRVKMIYQDLVQAQNGLVLRSAFHLLHLVTSYDLAEQLKPAVDIYFDAYSQLNENDLKAARLIGVTEACMTRIRRGETLKNLSERTYKRFYLTLMLNDLWSEKSLFYVAEKFKVNRGLVQQLVSSSAAFAFTLRHFCTKFTEFSCFIQLLDDISGRLAFCCTPELVPLMELPSVKKARAKQLFAAGFKDLKTIATSSAFTLVRSVPNLDTRTAIKIINAAKVILLKKIENLKEDAQDILEISENQLQL